MRIASLVPSATEMLFALGLGDSVVAVTHECDYPPQVGPLPRLTRSVVPDGLEPEEIDKAVKAIVGEGRALYELDESRLAELEPDLIVTQAVCPVCAVSYEDVAAIAQRLPRQPRVLSQDPSTLSEVLDNVVELGTAAGVPDAGRELRGDLEGRLATVRATVAEPQPPRVVALEWLDPPYVAGHWVPEMISIAGGDDVAGPPGLRSAEVSWGAMSGLDPDIVIAMPCGWYVENSKAQALRHWKQIEELDPAKAFAVDAASSFSRPGPRLVDGVELLAHLFHPELVDPPGGLGFEELHAPSRPAVT